VEEKEGEEMEDALGNDEEDNALNNKYHPNTRVEWTHETLWQE
jgi:hypothetical protein